MDVLDLVGVALAEHDRYEPAPERDEDDPPIFDPINEDDLLVDAEPVRKARVPRGTLGKMIAAEYPLSKESSPEIDEVLERIAHVFG